MLAGAVVLVVSSGLRDSGGGLTLGQIALLVGHMVFMFGVCLLAWVVPTRRALRVEPTEALRVE